MKTKLATCKFCKGKGKMKEPWKKHKTKVQKNKMIAIKMRKQGYSVRQIMRHLGYQSERSITQFWK